MLAKEINGHRVMHSDLMECDINVLLQNEKINVMYSDPPWGEGNLKYWQTINHKMTGAEKSPVDLDSFLDKIFTIAKDNVTEYVFIEYGTKWKQKIMDLAIKYGLVHQMIVPLLYKGGGKFLPLDLHVMTKKGVSSEIFNEEWVRSVTGTYGYGTLQAVLRPLKNKGMSIIDPCCGMGYTARASIDYNMRFYGNELNSARLEKTIAKLK